MLRISVGRSAIPGRVVAFGCIDNATVVGSAVVLALLATKPDLGVAEVITVLPESLEVCSGVLLQGAVKGLETEDAIMFFSGTESDAEDKVLLILVACE